MKIAIRNLACVSLFSIVALLCTPAVAATTASEAGSAVWNPSGAVIDELQKACDSPTATPAQLACMAQRMKAAGASADAVRFTRALFESKQQIGIMVAYKDFKSVALAGVLYPFHPEAKEGLLFVNSDPNFLDPNDVSNIDRTTLEHDATFQQWNKTAMTLKLWPNAVTAASRQVESARIFWGDKPGEIRFLFSYRLGSGTPGSGPTAGFANYWWTFDGNGKYLGAKLLSVAHGMPPRRKADLSEPDTSSGPAARPNAAPGATPRP
jgi:hypothetical protein